MQQERQRYPTATITELPAESDTAATVEEETVVEGEDFLSPADYVGGENYLANIAQVRQIQRNRRIIRYKGASIYDVRTEGEGGTFKSRHSKQP